MLKVLDLVFEVKASDSHLELLFCLFDLCDLRVGLANSFTELGFHRKG
jgi:hypothetical protein